MRSLIATAAAALLAGTVLSTAAVAAVSPVSEPTGIVAVKADAAPLMLAQQPAVKGKGKAKSGDGKGKKGGDGKGKKGGDGKGKSDGKGKKTKGKDKKKAG